MKILILNTLENSGGAAKAARRLFETLEKEHDVYYFVHQKESDSPRVIGPVGFIQRFLARLVTFLDAKYVQFKYGKTERYFSCSKFSLRKFSKAIKDIKPDLINVHWVQGGMISIKELKHIKEPIIWTLHDSWLFTGGCHLPYTCRRYQNVCGKCPALRSSNGNDLSNEILAEKIKIFDSRKDYYITPSEWLKSSALSSNLLKDKAITTIPNVLNENIFKPLDRHSLKRKFNFSISKKIVLFGAKNALNDFNKGGDLFFGAMELLDNEKYQFVFYGDGAGHLTSGNHIDLGEIKDESIMAEIINASDVVVVPSRSENLSYAIMESISCKTPVVAFAVGGNVEQIRHLENGILLDEISAGSLASGIEIATQINRDKITSAHIPGKKMYLEYFETLHQKRNT